MKTCIYEKNHVFWRYLLKKKKRNMKTNYALFIKSSVYNNHIYIYIVVVMVVSFRVADVRVGG